MDKESFNCITNTLKQLAVRRPDTFDGINTGVDRELTLCWHDEKRERRLFSFHDVRRRSRAQTLALDFEACAKRTMPSTPCS